MALTRASAAVVKTEELVNNRNLIINGAMQIAQRNTSVTGITTSNYYTADRWVISLSSVGTWTMNVDSSGPTNTEFRNSANLICTTADSSLSASDLCLFQQRLEGQNLQGVKKGTSAAESLTVSFYVKSSNTGTYICEFFDNDNTRQISKSYTINTANTWEKKTITVPPDTTGQFDNDNATSLFLFFCLAAGSDRTSGTLNDSTWASNVNANRNVGQLNLANAVGNYWAVTGIQLEVGSTATPFERRQFGTELALCQRYCQKVGTQTATREVFAFGHGANSTTVIAYYFPQVPFRGSVSLTVVGNTAIDDTNGPSQLSSLALNTTYSGGNAVALSGGIGSGVTQFRPYVICAFNSTSAYLLMTSEL